MAFLSKDITGNTLELDWAIITPSYDVDFVRCQLLCRSMDELLEGSWHHYIIADAPDMALFKALKGPRRTVLAKADILPKGTYRFLNTRIFKSQRFRRLWWSSAGPVAGWQVQQLVKIAIANHIEHENLLLCDSDMFFVKRLWLSSFRREGKLRLFRTETAAPIIEQKSPGAWISSEQFLVLPAADRHYSYGGNLITWRRSDVLAMQQYIAKVHGKPWQIVLRKPGWIYEHILYGLFVDIVKGKSDDIYYDHLSPCKTLSFRESLGNLRLEDYCADLQPHECALGIQSNMNLEPGPLNSIYEKLRDSFYGRDLTTLN